jgi:serine/threonine-protein kinase
MSAGPRPSDAPSELPEQSPVSAIRLRFEEEWKAARRPRIEEYLGGAPEPQRAALLRQLLAVELVYLRQGAEPRLQEEYLRRFPAHAALVAEVFRAAPASAPPILADTTDHVAEPGSSKVLLEVLEGPNQGARFEFDRHATLIAGRANTTQLRLADDPYFSRHHFLLEFQPPRCYLRDLGSRNGTLLNGRVVKEAFLKDGDIIGGGRTRIRFTLRPGEGQLLETTLPCLACAAPIPFAIRTSPPDPAFPPSALCPSCRQAMQNRPQPVPGYEIVRQLGRGGMGVVHLARHSTTGQPVALKLIVPEALTSDRAVQMFLREVSVLCQLNHPRIVRFQEVGMARGQFFFAMEYVPTVDLDELLARQSARNAVKTLCGLFCQVLDALGHAHQRGFVHRDVKPANLLISRTGQKLRLKLADFGLAKRFENGGFSGMTRHGDRRGSLPFMAPEQVLDCRTAKPPADLYSTAAALYFWLAGATPHDFSTGKDPYAIILEEDVVPLLERRPELPPGLAAVIHRSIAREPAQRFASAAAMRQALRPFARGPTADQ